MALLQSPLHVSDEVLQDSLTASLREASRIMLATEGTMQAGQCRGRAALWVAGGHNVGRPAAS